MSVLATTMPPPVEVEANNNQLFARGKLYPDVDSCHQVDTPECPTRCPSFSTTGSRWRRASRWRLLSPSVLTGTNFLQCVDWEKLEPDADGDSCRQDDFNLCCFCLDNEAGLQFWQKAEPGPKDIWSHREAAQLFTTHLQQHPKCKLFENSCPTCVMSFIRTFEEDPTKEGLYRCPICREPLRQPTLQSQCKRLSNMFQRDADTFSGLAVEHVLERMPRNQAIAMLNKLQNYRTRMALLEMVGDEEKQEQWHKDARRIVNADRDRYHDLLNQYRKIFPDRPTNQAYRVT